MLQTIAWIGQRIDYVASLYILVVSGHRLSLELFLSGLPDYDIVVEVISEVSFN